MSLSGHAETSARRRVEILQRLAGDCWQRHQAFKEPRSTLRRNLKYEIWLRLLWGSHVRFLRTLAEQFPAGDEGEWVDVAWDEAVAVWRRSVAGEGVSERFDFLSWLTLLAEWDLVGFGDYEYLLVTPTAFDFLKYLRKQAVLDPTEGSLAAFFDISYATHVFSFAKVSAPPHIYPTGGVA